MCLFSLIFSENIEENVNFSKSTFFCLLAKLVWTKQLVIFFIKFISVQSPSFLEFWCSNYCCFFLVVLQFHTVIVALVIEKRVQTFSNDNHLHSTLSIGFHSSIFSYLFPFMNLKLFLPLSSWFPFSKHFWNCQYFLPILVKWKIKFMIFICNWKIDICICISTHIVTDHHIPHEQTTVHNYCVCQLPCSGNSGIMVWGARKSGTMKLGSTWWGDSMESTASPIP